MLHILWKMEFNFCFRWVDGGLKAFMPPGDIQVSPFPAKHVRRMIKRTPEISLPDDAYQLSKLFLWALKPPSNNILTNLYCEGEAAALKFVKQNPLQK